MNEQLSTPARPGLLADKRCLLIGGTGGIGAAAARRFLEEGAAVVVAGLDTPDSARTHAELCSFGRCAFLPCDATVPAELERLFRGTMETLGGLDVLYHLAGGSGRRLGDGSLTDCTLEGWNATLQWNLTGTFLSNQAAVRHFLAHQQPGVILNLASVLAVAPSPVHFDTCAYAAAKGAIMSLSRLAAARYAADSIRVNVLAPGLIDTPMARRAVEDPAITHYLRSKQPLRGGPGLAEDCADAAVFLCSDRAGFITGAVLPVDGGWCVSEGQSSGK